MQPEVERAALERKRQEALIASKATTHQTLEGAVADSDRFSGMLASSEADLKRAQALLNSSRAHLEAEKLRLAALDTRDAGYRADIQAKQAAIVVAERNLGLLAPDAPQMARLASATYRMGSWSPWNAGDRSGQGRCLDSG